MKHLIVSLLLFLFLLLPAPLLAHQVTYGWYIKDFHSDLTVNKDSSVDIVEKITADCLDCTDKHGIFRVLPTRTKTPQKTYQTPIKLRSITDFNGLPLNYTTIKNPLDHTITWKIGDANRTVTGVNSYQISYHVDNAIRFENANFDEFYWNLNGNFWDLETDNFVATINLPAEVTQANSKIDYYTGSLGQQRKDLARYTWTGAHQLSVSTTQPLDVNQGVTLSVTMPKGIFIPYHPSLWQIIAGYLPFGIPIVVFMVCFNFWRKFGRDPKIHRSTAPEFGPPDNMTPLEMSLLIGNGRLDKNKISAEIVYLAVNKIITIEEIPKQGLFGHRDFKLNLVGSISSLPPVDKTLVSKLFGSEKSVIISSLKNKFYLDLPDIESAGKQELLDKKLISPKGFSYTSFFIVMAGVMLGLAFLSFKAFWIPTGIALVISAIITVIFGLLMLSRTQKGAELLKQIQGFELYMKVAEKYRQKFNEKENIFERFLPYAILFGITGLWIKKMEALYGKEYFANYYPYWYVGSMSTNFSIGNFTADLNAISSNMAGSMGSPSGSGGGGFSGGGGGGGGGGGW